MNAMKAQTIRRAIAVGCFGLIGGVGAFTAGAWVSSAMHSHLGSTTVARVPFSSLQAAVMAQANAQKAASATASPTPQPPPPSPASAIAAAR